jgi:hypothetical protein
LKGSGADGELMLETLMNLKSCYTEQGAL